MRRRSSGWPVLIVIALAAGWTNLGYVLGTLYGEVMQVLLLFYLAPLWTVLFARGLLNEKPGAQGYLVIGLAFAGAVVMLWRPDAGLPLPQGAADWMGLSAGVMFALVNVLSRKSEEHSIAVKSVSVFAGVTLLSLLLVIFAPLEPPALPAAFAALPVAMLLLLSVVILAVNLVVQHGLAHTPANQAIVIFLFELVVGALSSYFLAHESMTTQQWTGGAMIVAASLFSGKLGEHA
ncbi:MAG: DMT family transporter [Burkholderiales bacterium]